MRFRLTAIVSGGQTGADRGGLDAAIALDLGWGGWAPEGWRAEDGEIPLIYRARMKCTSSPDYGMRTRLNVQDSDGTLVVSFSPTPGGGTEFTLKTCERQNKSHLHIVLPLGGRTQMPDAIATGIREWVDKARISILNVAGPRESKERGIQEATRDLLVWVFEPEQVIAQDSCIHPSKASCASCSEPCCMDCRCPVALYDGEMKTAVRWCTACDPNDLGRLGRLENRLPDIDSDAPREVFGPHWECPERCGSTGGPHTHGGPAQERPT